MENDSMISPTPTQMTDADMEVEIIDYSEQDESAMIPEVEEIEDSKERMDTVEQAEGEAELEMVDVNTGEEEMVEEPMFQDEPILEDINVEALEVVGTLPLSFDSVTTIAEVEPEVSSILELIQPSAEAEIDYSTEEPVEVSTSTVTTLSTKIEPEISQETEIAVAQLELEGNLVNSTTATTTNITSTLFTAQPPQFEEPLDVKGKGREKVVDLENDDLSTSGNCSCTKLRSSRPHIKRNLLDIIQVDGQQDPFPSTSTLSAPSIMLVHECITYSLFQPQEDVNEDASSNFGRTVLFGEVEDQGLYYEKIGVFIEALQSLTEFQTIGSEEMVVTFPEIGISISADNVYTQKVSLHDFDRIHVGCGLPDRLSIVIETQTRFVTNFNTLLEHIKAESELAYTELESIGSDLIDGLEESAQLSESNLLNPNLPSQNESITLEADVGDTRETRSETFEVPDEEVLDEEFEVEHAAYEEGFDALVGEWNQEQGEESEYARAEMNEEQSIYEEALAELDSDDLAAVVEGAIQDLSSGPDHKDDTFEDGELEVIVDTSSALEVVLSSAPGTDSNVEGVSRSNLGLEAEPVEALIPFGQAEIVAYKNETPTGIVEPVIDTAASELVSLQDGATLDGTLAQSFEISYDSPVITVAFDATTIPLMELTPSDAKNSIVDELVLDSTTLDASKIDAGIVTIVEEAEVAIDYDEVIEPVISDATTLVAEVPQLVSVAALAGSVTDEESKSPKRTREQEMELSLEVETSNGHAKRPKLAEEISL